MMETVTLLKMMLKDQAISFGSNERFPNVLSVMYTYKVHGLELPGIIVVHPTKKKSALHVHADGKDAICYEAIQAYVQICLILKKRNATNNGKHYRDVPTPQDCAKSEGLGKCEVCDQPLGKRGGYEDSGMCGPCCTGEADTHSEFGVSW